MEEKKQPRVSFEPIWKDKGAMFGMFVLSGPLFLIYILIVSWIMVFIGRIITGSLELLGFFLRHLLQYLRFILD